MRALLYLIAIVAANVVTAKFQPMNLFGFIIPYGTWFIGLTFILRDLTQNKYGRKKTYLFISLALLLSALTSLGSPMYVVFASAISFAVSETTDTEIYSRLKLPMHMRILYSGIVGGILDSSIFVIIGLSPIGMDMLPWAAVPAAILGQVIVKSVLQGIGALGVKYTIKA